MVVKTTEDLSALIERVVAAQKKFAEFGGIRLHASRLRFEHPVTNEVIDVAAPLLKTDALWQAYGGL